jgi:hypothetical protein
MSYYYFELVMAGIILLATMTGIGITRMVRRRSNTKLENTLDEKNHTDMKSEDIGSSYY